jgi:hypothetical protein
MRDYRGTRRISAPSVFLAEMTGSETVVEGDEAPPAGGRPGFDPFGDAARAAADEFAAEIHEDASAAAPRLKVFRPDGLTLETEESQAEDGEAAQARGPARKRRDRATDLATWAMPQAGSPGAEPRFEPGQRVRHAEYGAGVLVKISGVGTRSVGTVTFDGPAGTRKFLLGHGGILRVQED